MFDSGVVLKGEIRRWSHLGARWLSQSEVLYQVTGKIDQFSLQVLKNILSVRFCNIAESDMCFISCADIWWYSMASLLSASAVM